LVDEAERTAQERRPSLYPLTPSLPLSRWLIAALHGHGSSVTALAVLPDGRLASVSYDHTVRVWDVRRGREVVALRADASIARLAVRPDGLIVAGDGLGCVHFLRLAG
jgi:WD40 repeat protein